MPIYKRRVLPTIGEIKLFVGDQAELDRQLLRGWAVADGTNGTFNLIDRFPKFEAMNKKGQTGGAKTVTPSGSVGVSVDNHTLSQAQMPSHSHTSLIQYANGMGSGTSFDGTKNGSTGEAGGSGAHNHGASGTFNGVEHANEPQYTATVPLQYVGF